MAGPIEKHPCDIGDGEIDHDMKYHTDSQGEGAWSMSYGWWECERCGEQEDGDPPSYEDDF